MRCAAPTPFSKDRPSVPAGLCLVRPRWCPVGHVSIGLGKLSAMGSSWGLISKSLNDNLNNRRSDGPADNRPINQISRPDRAGIALLTKRHLWTGGDSAAWKPAGAPRLGRF